MKILRPTLIVASVAMIAFTLVIAIKGNITNSSLSEQLEEQNELLADAQDEALTYGITVDDDGDIVMPVSEESQNEPELDWDSVKTRNETLLQSFAECILTFNGNDEYNAKRQQLIDNWGFTEDSDLLSDFMRPLEDGEILEYNMDFVGPATVFTLSDDGKNISYFLICTVRSSTGSTSADGTVGIRITINADGTVSDVTAQTMAI